MRDARCFKRNVAECAMELPESCWAGNCHAAGCRLLQVAACTAVSAHNSA